MGLRERGKRERLRRIKEAAVEAFRSEGYEGASTREIARIADVSIGTLFVYAKDKRDLLFLVLNEDLDKISLDSIAAKRHERTVASRDRSMPISLSNQISPARSRVRSRISSGATRKAANRPGVSMIVWTGGLQRSPRS